VAARPAAQPRPEAARASNTSLAAARASWVSGTP
jgi:hypothetical protein